MRVNKKISIIIAIVASITVAIWSFLLLYIEFGYLYIPGDIDTYFNSNNKINSSRSTAIKEGMSYNEVIVRIGKANYMSGSGFTFFVYECSDGKQISLYMVNTDMKKNDPLIVDKIIVNDGD